MRNNELEVIPSPPISFAMTSTSSKEKTESLFFFIGGVVALLIVLILFFIFWKIIRTWDLKKLIQSTKKHDATSDLFSGNLRAVTYFEFDTLKKATKNFHINNLLGRGGFGPVYQGKLDDGRWIAVKKLSLDKSQQGESEFLSEVRMITSIQHKNLVRLLGCCSFGPQRLLVYEYMKNRSLELIVYGKSDQFLSWEARFQIILGVARGLQYLHEDSNLRIVHRDIKASNVLLDDKFHPKIGDFGLARFFPEDQAYLSTTFAGTLGYTAPEYAIRGELSEKADIYSFGVLVLEIISCRKNTDISLQPEMQYLPEYAWKLYERSSVTELVDSRMKKDGYVEKDVLRAIHAAFLCLQPQPNLRPPMSEIVAFFISNGSDQLAITPTKPAFLDRRLRNNALLSRDTITEHLQPTTPSFKSEAPSPSLPQP